MGTRGRREQRPVGEGDAGRGLQVVHVVDAALLAGGDGHDAPTELAHDLEEGDELGAIGEAARYRLPVDAAVGDGKAGGQAGGAGQHGLAQDRLHGDDLVRRGRALVGVIAHGEQAQGGVADVGREVEPGAPALHRRQVLGEGGEVPRDPSGERLDVHVLDVFEGAGDELPMLRPGRRDGKAAVARHDGGDAVVAGRGDGRVPEDLGVVVGVDVDEAGGDDVVTGVEGRLPLEPMHRWP